MPVLFEFFLDSTLGDGELCGGGFFVLFLLYALGPQGLSASGGPSVSVPAALCSGASCSGFSFFVVLASFGGLLGESGPFDRLRVSGGKRDGMGSRPVSSTGQALRGNDGSGGGNDDFAWLRVSGGGLSLGGFRPFDGLRVSGSFDGAQDRVRGMGSRFRGNDGSVVWVPLCLGGNDGLFRSHPHPNPLPSRERG